MKNIKLKLGYTFANSDREVDQTFDKEFEELFPFIRKQISNLFKAYTDMDLDSSISVHAFKTSHKGIQNFDLDILIHEEGVVNCIASCILVDAKNNEHYFAKKLKAARHAPMWMHFPESREGSVIANVNAPQFTTVPSPVMKSSYPAIIKPVPVTPQKENAKQLDLDIKKPTTDHTPFVPTAVHNRRDNAFKMSKQDLVDLIHSVDEDPVKVSRLCEIPLADITAVLTSTDTHPEVPFLSNIVERIEKYFENRKNGRASVKASAVEISNGPSPMEVVVKEEVKLTPAEARIRGFCGRAQVIMTTLGYTDNFDEAVKAGLSGTVLQDIRNGRYERLTENEILTSVDVLYKIFEAKSKANPQKEVEKQLRAELADKIYELIQPVRHLSQRAIGDIIGIDQTYVSKILRKANPYLTSEKLTKLLSGATKGMKEYKEAEAKKLLKTVEKEAKDKIKKEEITPPEVKSIEKLGGELRAVLISLKMSDIDIAAKIGISVTVVAKIMALDYSSLSEEKVILYKEYAELIKTENENKAPVTKVKSLSDIANIKDLKPVVKHPCGVVITQYKKDYLVKADAELRARFGKVGSYKPGRINDLYFNDNKKRLTIISKNSMEVSKLTGIPYNTVLKAFNFAGKIPPREQMAINLYLNDIWHELEAISSVVV